MHHPANTGEADLVISRYLGRELLTTMGGVLLVLMLIFASKHFVRYLSQAASGGLPADLVLRILGYFLLASLIFILPFAFFITVLITLGRMYQDSEVTALEACGVGTPRILSLVFVYALMMSAVVAALSIWIAPWAEEKQFQVRDEARARSRIGLVVPGRFHQILGGEGVIYTREMDEHATMREVFIYRKNATGLDVFSADSGVLQTDIQGQRYLVLSDGQRYEEQASGQAYRIHDYARTGIRLEEGEGNGAVRRSRVAWSMQRLFDGGSGRDMAEIQWRYSMPLSVLLLAVAAALLSRTGPRQGRFGKLFLALIVYAVYFNFMTLSQNWLRKEQIPTYLGIWWVHASLILFIVWLMWRQYGGAWFRSLWTRQAA